MVYRAQSVISMRLLLLSSVVVFLSFANGWSQIITVSDELNLRSEYTYDVLGKVGEHTLVIRDGINEFDIFAYNDRMARSWTVEEKLENRKCRIINVIAHPDRVHVVYSDEWRDTLAILVRHYDARIRLQETDTIVQMKKGLTRPRYRFLRSEDRNIFLMTEMENEKVVSAFAYHLRERELLWESKFVFGQVNFREEYRKTLLANDGTMYLVFERNNYRYRKSDHTFEIFKFQTEERRMVVTTIPAPEFITYDAHFRYDNINEQIVAVGFYSDRNTGSADGIFYWALNAMSYGQYNLSLVNYDEELVADFHGKYATRRGSLTNLAVRDVVLRQDGGLLMFAEESKEFERLSYAGRRDFYGGARFSVDYYYEDLVLISIHPDGSAHWQKLLPKRQYSNDDNAAYSSYFLVKNPSFLRILYNDEIRNENTVSEYILNGAGDITRRSLMSTDHQRLKLQVKNAIQTSSDEVVIPSLRGRRLKLLKLKYT